MIRFSCNAILIIPPSHHPSLPHTPAPAPAQKFTPQKQTTSSLQSNFLSENIFSLFSFNLIMELLANSRLFTASNLFDFKL
jgi:hypothetical protein